MRSTSSGHKSLRSLLSCVFGCKGSLSLHSSVRDHPCKLFQRGKTQIYLFFYYSALFILRNYSAYFTQYFMLVWVSHLLNFCHFSHTKCKNWFFLCLVPQKTLENLESPKLYCLFKISICGVLLLFKESVGIGIFRWFFFFLHFLGSQTGGFLFHWR